MLVSRFGIKKNVISSRQYVIVYPLTVHLTALSVKSILMHIIQRGN